jgi:hypothetical protein
MQSVTWAQQPVVAKGTIRGQQIDHPERMSGSWETSDGGSVYGLHIQLTSLVVGAPVTLAGARRTWSDAILEVYLRTGSARKLGDGNGFSADSPDVRWDLGHLLVNYAGSSGTPAVNLNLIFDPSRNIWTGRFHCGTFDREVVLRRPHPSRGIAKSPFVGTWRRDGPMNNCIHIVQNENGSLAGWSDDLSMPGAFRYANGIRPPRETYERYGAIALVEATAAGIVTLELKALTPTCCSITYVGRLASNGKEIRELQRVRTLQSNWKRMPEDSCIADDPKGLSGASP